MERPILFSGEMVRAILDGRKTQTRRVVKPQPVGRIGMAGGLTHIAGQRRDLWRDMASSKHYSCPYGQPGDRLWVRETFRQVASGEVRNGYGKVRYGVAYRADASVRWQSHTTTIHDLSGQPDTGPMQFKPRPWKPGIHMPRRAARLTLEITAVRVQRLQEINDEDALAEGIQRFGKTFIAYDDATETAPTPVSSFRSLWDSLNAKRGVGWEVNPFVWAISFKRLP